MRTFEEIVKRIEDTAGEDWLGFEVNEYFRALTPEQIEVLKPRIIKQEADLSKHVPDLTNDEAIRKCCIDYMPFAWDKANNCRGISAGRSLAHYKAWLWMLGTDEFEGIDEYEYYGKPQLVQICAFFGLDSARWDDGRRVNDD